MSIKVLVVVDYIPPVDIMESFLREASFEVKVTEDRDALLPESIVEYDVFLDYMHGGLLNKEQTKSVVDFVAGGKALVGVHSAAVDKNSPEFMSLLGGKYIGHSGPEEAKVTVVDDNHPITEGISDFSIIDEIYKLDFDPTPLRVLIEGDADGKTYPVCWVRECDKGRVAFLSLGHGEEAFENKTFQELVVRCVKWAVKQI